MGNFLTRYRKESIWDRRGAAAFALTPLVPAFLYALSSGDYFPGALMLGAMIAYGYMLILGLPLVTLVNWRRRISLVSSVLGGATVALLPWVFFMGTTMLQSQTPLGYNGIAGMIFSFGYFGSLGCIAGGVWWYIACYPRPLGTKLTA